MHRKIMIERMWLLVYFIISLLSENRHLLAITLRTAVIIKSDLPCARLEIYRIFLSSNYRYPQIAYYQHFSGKFDASLRYLQEMNLCSHTISQYIICLLNRNLQHCILMLNSFCGSVNFLLVIYWESSMHTSEQKDFFSLFFKYERTEFEIYDLSLVTQRSSACY